MMTCAECLSTVLIADRNDLGASSAVGEHCASCENCRSVVTDVVNREERVASMLDDLRMSSPPALIAQQALAANRRVTAHFWRLGLFAALIVTGVVAILNWGGPSLRRAVGDAVNVPVVTETIPLKCVTPTQAMSLATPYLRSNAAIYTTPGIPAVTIRGKPKEFDQARHAIEEFDLACQLPQQGTGVRK